MEQARQQKHILILESDRQLEQQIQEYLCGQASLVTAPSSVKEALHLLKGQKIHLAFLGDATGGSSSFDILKDFVKSWPMTYVILITDTPEKEVHDRAEGFGILGHIPRAFSPNQIERPIDKYRKINQGLFRKSNRFSLSVLGLPTITGKKNELPRREQRGINPKPF